jgi:hypothetical protein
MPESYMSKDVQCPYYHKDVHNKICCEGIDEEGSIHLNFTSEKKRIAYEREKCCKDYKQCMLTQMLDRKYSEHL